MVAWPDGHRWEDYKVAILDKNCAWKGELNSLHNLKGNTRRYGKYGCKITFSLSFDDPWASVLNESELHFIDVWRDSTQIWSGYQVKLDRDDDIGEEEQWVEFEFLPLSRLLQWRVGLPIAPATAFQFTDHYDDVFKDMVLNSIGSSAPNTPTTAISLEFPNFQVAADDHAHGTNDTLDATRANIYEYLQMRGRQYGIDWDVLFDSSYQPTFYTWVPRRGSDKTEGQATEVIFSDDNDNITRQRYGQDTQDLYTVILAGDGESDVAAAAGVRTSWLVRAKLIKSTGADAMNTALGEHDVKEFYKLQTFVETEDRQWVTHWDIGDKITWKSNRLDYGPYDDEVGEVIFEIDEDGYEHLIPVFGEPEPDALDKLRGASGGGAGGDPDYTAPGSDCFWVRGKYDTSESTIILRPKTYTDPVLLGAEDVDASEWIEHTRKTYLDLPDGNIRVARSVYNTQRSLAFWGMSGGVGTVHIVDETLAEGGAGGSACIADVYDADVPRIKLDADTDNPSFVQTLLEIQEADGDIAHSFDATTGAVILNEQGLSTGDVRVEADSDENLIFADATDAGKVGIGDGAPDHRLDVAGDINIHNAFGLMINDTATDKHVLIGNGTRGVFRALRDADLPATYVETSRILTAGAGLTGGGDLSADRTVDVGAGTGIGVNANDVQLSHLGIEALADPNVDRIMFWDETENAMKWLSPGTLLSISGTGLNCAVAHSDTTGRTANDHHNQAHTHGLTYTGTNSGNESNTHTHEVKYSCKTTTGGPGHEHSYDTVFDWAGGGAYVDTGTESATHIHQYDKTDTPTGAIS